VSGKRFLDRVGCVIVLIGALVVAALLVGCRGVWDNRANGGEIITLGTPEANPCAPTCPKAAP